MKFNWENLVNTLILIIIAVIIYQLIKIALKRINHNTEHKRERKNNTYFVMIKSILKYVYLVIIVLLILQVNGIDVTAMLTGLGIVGVVIGLAIQDALKDIIRGISIISENYYMLGDVVKIGDNTGIVLELGIKTTKIKDLITDNIVSIANRNIDKVEVLSTTLNINVPLPYETKIEDAEIVMQDIMKDVKEIKNVNSVEYRGVAELSSSSIDYRIYISCNPKYRYQVRRDALRNVLLVLDKHEISVPYNQLDIHNK